MKIALIAVAVVVLVGAVASASLLSSGGETPAALTTAGAASVSPSSSDVSPSSAPAPSSASGSGSDDGTAPGRSPAPAPGDTSTSGSEVPAATAAPKHTLPPITQAPPLVAAPLPASGTKSGALVAGFPTKVMGPAARTVVVSSSIAADGRTMQAALVGRSTASPADIRTHYAQLWASLGLVPQQTTDGTTAYRSPYDSLTLSFDPSGTGTHYTVFGVFRTR